MKIDRFTWSVVAVVAILLAAAIITVNLSDGRGTATDSYLTENLPATPVYNAFVAFETGDVQMARRQYSQRVLDDNLSETGYNPFSDRFAQGSARRLRIIDVVMDEANPSRAFVNAAIDTYSSSGLFNTGSTWTRRLVLDVVLESQDDGSAVWKMDTLEFFY